MKLVCARGTLGDGRSEAVLARSPAKLEGRPRHLRTARENSDCVQEGSQGPVDKGAQRQGQRKGRAGDDGSRPPRAQQGALQALEHYWYLICKDVGDSLNLTNQQDPYDAETKRRSKDISN